jgi:DNA-binding IclR family transcriptional regulator
VELEEFAEGISGVASAVFSPAGAPVAAIGVSGRADAFDFDLCASSVRTAAETLTRRLSARGASLT